MITWKARSGFTIVELLVVTGILAILLALLIPSFSRARESARSAVCISNLRQIGNALVGYALDNHGYFPANAVFNPPRSSDWVFWQAGRDLQKSAIARRMGDNIPPKVLICPSDDPSVRFSVLSDPYPYSYTFNQTFASNNPIPPVCRLAAVKRSSEKLLVICEDEHSIDDGNWDPRHWDPVSPIATENALSNRHARPCHANWQSTASLPKDQRPDRSDMGNVAFADGHAAQVPRNYTWEYTNYRALEP